MAKATALKDTVVLTEESPAPETFIASFPPVQTPASQVYTNGPISVSVVATTGIATLTCAVDPVKIVVSGEKTSLTLDGAGASGTGVSVGGAVTDAGPPVVVTPTALPPGTYVVGAYFEGTCPADTVAGWKAPTQTVPAGIRPTPKTFFTTTISVPTR